MTTHDRASDGTIQPQAADLFLTGQDAVLQVLRAEMVALCSLMAALPDPLGLTGRTDGPPALTPDEAVEQDFDNMPV